MSLISHIDSRLKEFRIKEFEFELKGFTLPNARDQKRRAIFLARFKKGYPVALATCGDRNKPEGSRQVPYRDFGDYFSIEEAKLIEGAAKVIGERLRRHTLGKYDDE